MIVISSPHGSARFRSPANEPTLTRSPSRRETDKAPSHRQPTVTIIHSNRLARRPTILRSINTAWPVGQQSFVHTAPLGPLVASWLASFSSTVKCVKSGRHDLLTVMREVSGWVISFGYAGGAWLGHQLLDTRAWTADSTHSHPPCRYACRTFPNIYSFVSSSYGRKDGDGAGAGAGGRSGGGPIGRVLQYSTL